MQIHSDIDFSLQTMRVFLKCCELLNFSEAAHQLGFTASMVSKTIKNLEDELGFKLFVRDYHDTKATPAARYLADEWRSALLTIEGSIEAVAGVPDEAAAPVRIGMIDNTSFCSNYVIYKMESMLAPAAVSSIHWEYSDMHQLPQDLENGSVDLIVTWSAELGFLDAETTEWRSLFTSPDALFVPWGHDLFDADISSLEQCRAYDFITLNPRRYPHYRYYLLDVCQQAGFIPHCTVDCDNTSSAYNNLLLGRGLYLAPSLICSGWEGEELRKVELDGCGGKTGLIVAWKADKLTAKMLACIDAMTH